MKKNPIYDKETERLNEQAKATFFLNEGVRAHHKSLQLKEELAKERAAMADKLYAMSEPV